MDKTDHPSSPAQVLQGLSRNLQREREEGIWRDGIGIGKGYKMALQKGPGVYMNIFLDNDGLITGYDADGREWLAERNAGRDYFQVVAKAESAEEARLLIGKKFIRYTPDNCDGKTWTANTTNWYPPGPYGTIPPPVAQNAILPETPASEKIRCPDCFTDVILPGNAFKDKHKYELECGCLFTEKRLAKALGRHAL
jgi:hypothetical protein